MAAVTYHPGVRRLPSLPRRLLPALLLGLFALLLAGGAAAQPATPALAITSLAFVPPRTVKAEVRYGRDDLHAPMLPQFTLRFEGQDVPASNTDHRHPDERDFTLLFELPIAPDGQTHLVGMSVRDHPSQPLPYLAEQVSLALPPATGVPFVRRSLAVDPAPLTVAQTPPAPSWTDYLDWKAWSALVVGAFLLLRWIRGLVTARPGPVTRADPPRKPVKPYRNRRPNPKHPNPKHPNPKRPNPRLWLRSRRRHLLLRHLLLLNDRGRCGCSTATRTPTRRSGTSSRSTSRRCGAAD